MRSPLSLPPFFTEARTPERCQSGRMGLSRKQKYPQGYRGFESLPLRQCTPVPPSGRAFSFPRRTEQSLSGERVKERPLGAKRHGRTMKPPHHGKACPNVDFSLATKRSRPLNAVAFNDHPASVRSQYRAQIQSMWSSRPILSANAPNARYRVLEPHGPFRFLT